MIDIHNHVIYSVDDGSKDLEQSIRMIKAAKAAGFDEICFTPHYMEDGYKTEKSVLMQKVDTIKSELEKEKIDVKLYLGEEIFIFPELAENLDRVVCLNDSRYILIEFPLVEEVNYIEEVIYRLCANGKVPIIAHPERYLSTEKDFSFIENIVQKGALLQININSISGHYGKSAKNLAVKLLKLNMVHFVGSDAHSSAGYIESNESLKLIKKIIGDEKLNELLEINPRKVIQDEDIEVNLYTKVEKKKSFFSMLLKKVV